jgi:hypothetical protein
MAAGGRWLAALAAVAGWSLGATTAEAHFLQTDPVGYKDDLDLYAYVGDDPMNHADPTGLSCTSSSSGDKTVYDCKIDNVAVIKNGKIVGYRAPTEKEQKSFAAFNARYTAAVNKIASRDPNSTGTVKAIAGGQGGFKISAGEAVEAMAGRQVTFAANLNPGTELATGGGSGVGQDPHTFVGGSGLRASLEHIVHDIGIHGTDAENTGGLQNATYPLGHLDHQQQYNQAACQLLGDGPC